MSMRDYFSLRYAVPGYTFLLLVTAINFFPIFRSLGNDATGNFASVFGALLAILSGSAIGFLVSQSWWWWFHRKVGLYTFRCVKFLMEKYNLTNKCDAKSKHRVVQVFDYIVCKDLHSDDKKKGLSLYAYRRWDVYVLLSSTLASILLGLMVGFLFRVLAEIYVFQASFFVSLSQLDFSFINSEFWLQILVLISATLLSFFIWKELDWTKFEYEELHIAIIKSSHITEADLKNIFQPEYFKDNRSASFTFTTEE